MKDEIQEYEDQMIAFRNEALREEHIAAIVVEDETDKFFWKKLFAEFCPQHSFLFSSGVKSKKGNKTYGTGQMIKFHTYGLLSRQFLLAIDSDYRYILQKNTISTQDFVFQTYAHSKENYGCNPKLLINLYGTFQKHAVQIFDFEEFMKEYSKCVYPIFIIFLYSLSKNDNQITADNFYEAIALNTPPDINNNAKKELALISDEVKRLSQHCSYTENELQTFENQLIISGLTKENVYWFLRGHNVEEDVILRIGNKIRNILESNLKQVVPKLKVKLQNRVLIEDYFPLHLLKRDISDFFTTNEI